MINPTIKLNVGYNVNLSAYNYCYIVDFGRYYWIEDILLDRTLIYISCRVDALASWKTQIGASSEYVLRSAQVHDGRITDTMYATRAQEAYYQRASGNMWLAASAGLYVVGLLAYVGSGSLHGGINYTAMTPNAFKGFMDLIFPAGPVYAGTAIEGAADAIKSVFANAAMSEEQAMSISYLAENPYTDYIDSITWVPLNTLAGMAATSETTLYLGRSALAVQHTPLDISQVTEVTVSFNSIPKHPQAATRGVYLNLAPYSEYSMVLPRVGRINIDPSYLVDYTHLTVKLSLDSVTGQGMYRVYSGDGNTVENLVYVDYAPIGVTVKIGTNKPVGSMFSTILGGVGAAIAENPIGVAGSFVNLIRERNSPSSGRIGDSGGFMGLQGEYGNHDGFCTLQSVHFYVVDDDLTNNGAPLCQVKQINTLSGYIKCLHGDIEAPATSEELRTIKGYMEGGFFYE